MVWLSGSGGAGKTPSLATYMAGKSHSIRMRRSRCPLQPVLGSPNLKDPAEHPHLWLMG